MKHREYNIDDRVERSGWSPPIDVDDIVYTNGLLDVLDFVLTDIRSLLINEGRFHGIMKTYSSTIRSSFSKVFKDVPSEEIEVYGRVLYVLKIVLKQEYKRLCKKGLTCADAGIVIAYNLSKVISNIMPDSYPNKKEVGTIKKILNKIWENIRHRGKGDAMISFANLLHRCFVGKILGKYPLDNFKLETETRYYSNLEGDGTRINNSWSVNTEINL